MRAILSILRGAFARRAPAPTRRGYRPTAESLEDRVVPSHASSVAPAQATPLQRLEMIERAAYYPPAPPFTEGRHRFESAPQEYRVDRLGVLMTYEHSRQQWLYNPTNIARYVMELYKSWQEGDDTALPRIRANARWLLLNAHPRFTASGEVFYVYPLPIGNAPFHIPIGAVSALTAADAMVALYLAGQVSADTSMLNLAQEMLPGFEVSVQAGGYRVPLGPHAAWYEEYAYPGVEPPRVLNGHMLAIADLSYYAGETHDPVAQALATIGINALVKDLHLYNSTPISAYDLELHNHILSYSRAHVAELTYLYHLTSIDLFRRYADMWAKQN